MIKYLAALALVMLPTLVNAQKVVDCSKMTPAQLRNVDDVEITCKKSPPVDKKKLTASLIASAKQSAKEVLSNAFKDPESVKFRNLRVSNDGFWVCGEVNAKNSYGGYTGYKRFYSTWRTGKIDTEDGDYFNKSYLTDKCDDHNSQPFK